ncbi:MAG: DUF4351 domain-containing protein [Magnetococcales bacterium]|nr:DUF4351 domain-containing protein [Magnetococcales bacterium]
MMSQFARDIIAKGKPQWLQEGEAIFLLRLLERRFGNLPGWVSKKVHASTQSTLEAWGDRVFDAQSLEEIFADQG